MFMSFTFRANYCVLVFFTSRLSPIQASALPCSTTPATKAWS